jgi:hypothetical protein
VVPNFAGTLSVHGVPGVAGRALVGSPASSVLSGAAMGRSKLGGGEVGIVVSR